MSIPTTCRFCGGPLTVVPVEGHPELADYTCRSRECGREWINQAPRCTGPGTSQVAVGSTGIQRMEHGQPERGEDNCGPVAKAMLAWLGSTFTLAAPCPEPGAKRDSKAERGFDFLLREPCGHESEVQVTRVDEHAHYSALARGVAVQDERSHSTLVDLIDHTVAQKSERTPIVDRQRRILAIDGRHPSIGFVLFTTRVKFIDMADVFRWRGVLLVDGVNTRFLDRDDWPTCPQCVR